MIEIGRGGHGQGIHGGTRPGSRSRPWSGGRRSDGTGRRTWTGRTLQAQACREDGAGRPSSRRRHQRAVGGMMPATSIPKSSSKSFMGITAGHGHGHGHGEGRTGGRRRTAISTAIAIATIMSMIAIPILDPHIDIDGILPRYAHPMQAGRIMLSRVRLKPRMAVHHTAHAHMMVVQVGIGTPQTRDAVRSSSRPSS